MKHKTADLEGALLDAGCLACVTCGQPVEGVGVDLWRISDRLFEVYEAVTALATKPRAAIFTLTDQDIQDLAGGGIPNDLPARCKAFIAAAAERVPPPADPLREALAELVACKDMKDEVRRLRSDPYYITEADSLEIKYERRRDAAWEAARAALAGQPVGAVQQPPIEVLRAERAVGYREGYEAALATKPEEPEAVDEARIEAAYWEFDARHKGYSPFTFQRSERDAFKQTIRRMLNGGEAIP